MDDYRQHVKALLKPERFEHSLNVAQQAVLLAKRYGEDQEKAYTAGILHDVCKNMSQQEQLHWMENSDIILDSTLRKQPPVWHGFAGAVYLRERLGIRDRDILNAVRYHTTAREGMSRLEQIIYLADLTSAERSYPDVEQLRSLTMQSLEQGMLYSLRYSIRKLLEVGQPVCLDTCRAYNQYLAVEKR